MIKEIAKNSKEREISPYSTPFFLNRKIERNTKIFQTDKTCSTDSSDCLKIAEDNLKLNNFSIIPFEPFEIMKYPKTTKSKPCSCKNSQCLKNYCECFATLSVCDPNICSCLGCSNTIENINIRNERIQNYRKKFQNVLKKKGMQKFKEKMGRCCTCKKSNCQKKYCECFQNNMSCGSSCRCQDCKNVKFEDSSLVSKSSSRTTSLNSWEDSMHNQNILSEYKKINFSKTNKKIIPIKLIINNYLTEDSNLIFRDENNIFPTQNYL